MFLSVLIFWLNEVHEDEGQTDTDTEPHEKYQQLLKDRKAKEAGISNWADVLSLHFSSVQFNSIHNFSST